MVSIMIITETFNAVACIKLILIKMLIVLTAYK